jgi:hydroxyethylthiazole kinase-like uncharacterized protein yjeF
MTEILSSAQMRAIEAACIDSGLASGLELMMRAGRAVADEICRRWPGRDRAIVLCGPGNNGGDGYVIARALAGQGWAVSVWAPQGAATPDAAEAAASWDGPLLTELGSDDLRGVLVVDALFGTGLTRPLDACFQHAMTLAQDAGAPLVAVDILSGVCADTGQIRAEDGGLGRGADLTVTFQAPKLGHMLLPGAAMSGALHVADIGLGSAMSKICAGASLARAAQAPLAARLHKHTGHKYTHGHVLVLAGGVGRGGAARLAARAALRIGAGLVTVGCPPSALIENAARLDAIMLRAVPDAAALCQLVDSLRITALCLGPGFGISAREVTLLESALRLGCPLVLDADALTLIAQTPNLRNLVHRKCMLTPHDGEFARLWPNIAADVALSKCDRVVRAAAEIGAGVLLKGVDTVIAQPQGWPIVHAALRERAAPELATAGTGDVLAGLIVGLIARGLPIAEAAADAAWLHVEAARGFGAGLIAEDLPEAMPRVLRGLC